MKLVYYNDGGVMEVGEVVRRGRYLTGSRAFERERRKQWKSSQEGLSHGKTRGEIFAILQGQGACCAICKSPRHGGAGWNGDHDHRTGLFRGVLCRGCNTGLGNFKDKVKVLRAAIYYLEHHVHMREKVLAAADPGEK